RSEAAAHPVSAYGARSSNVAISSRMKEAGLGIRTCPCLVRGGRAATPADQASRRLPALLTVRFKFGPLPVEVSHPWRWRVLSPRLTRVADQPVTLATSVTPLGVLGSWSSHSPMSMRDLFHLRTLSVGNVVTDRDPLAKLRIKIGGCTIRISPAESAQFAPASNRTRIAPGEKRGATATK